MLNITINTEWDFFTIFWLYCYLNKELEKWKEYVRNDDFKWTIEWNWINLRLHRMCWKMFNKDDRFKISLEWEYSYEDIYSITLLLNEVVSRYRLVIFLKTNNK